MRLPRPILALIILSLPVLLGQCHARASVPKTWLHLADGSTGREIALAPLTDGRRGRAHLAQFPVQPHGHGNLYAEGGRLILTEVVYEDPRGLEPPLAQPEDVEELVQTGGPFRVTGSRNPSRASFSVLERSAGPD